LWRGQGYEGWIDQALWMALTARQASSPDDLFEIDGAEVVRSRRNLTVRVALDDTTVWLKRFRAGSMLERIIYGPKPGKAAYAWNAAMALREHGFCTPAPVIGLRAAGRWGGAAGIVGFEDLGDGASLRSLLADNALPVDERESLLRELGGCLRRFHDLGFRHRDLRKGNVLVRGRGAARTFCFLDLNRLRVQKPLSTVQRLREVEKLNLPAETLTAFFDAYMPDRNSGTMAAACVERVSFANKLGRLPLGKLLMKTWYYAWELRAYSRARRP